MTDVTTAWLAERQQLTTLAYGVLGDWAGAEDVVAHLWERAERARVAGAEISNPSAWLRVVCARLALDEAGSARARREEYVGSWLPEPVPTEALPEQLATTRHMLRLGLLRLLHELGPLERTVFVLREAFELPYNEIAVIVDKSPASCRQMVSRARRSLPSAPTPDAGALTASLENLVQAVIDADIDKTTALISDGAVLISDSNGILRVAPRPLQGNTKIARFFLGVQAKNPILSVALVSLNYAPALRIESADGIRILTAEYGTDGRLAELQMHANPAKVARARMAMPR